MEGNSNAGICYESGSQIWFKKVQISNTPALWWKRQTRWNNFWNWLVIWLEIYWSFLCTNWKKKLFDCPKNKCSNYAIIGEDQIEEKLKQIEKYIDIENKTWEPSEHVEEFIELFKELVFIAQGNAYAPVTDSAISKQTSKDIDKAGTLENICFWTPDQLSIADAVEMEFVFLNSFYSTGKTTLLKHRAKYLNEKNKDLTKKNFTQIPVKLK